MIFVDNRETRSVPDEFFMPHITKYSEKMAAKYGKISYVRKQLTVGDYLVVTPSAKPVVIIERKTWKDLSASISDSRMGNNEKLLEYSRNTGARILYIIEGSKVFYDDETRVGRKPFKMLIGKLLTQFVVDGIPFMHTSSPQHTAKTITYFAYKAAINDDALPMKPIVGGFEEIEKDITRVRTYTVSEVHRKLWQAFDGIGPSTVDSIMANFNLVDFILEPPSLSSIAELTCGETLRKIGNAKARKIINCIGISESVISKAEASDKCAKILKQINGITQNTAGLIANKYSLHEIVKMIVVDKDISPIENLTRPNGKKLGKRIATALRGVFEKSE